MRALAKISGFARALAALRRDRRGIAAVEFALLLPIMLALYLGGVEVSEGLSASRKVTLTAGALVNLAAQATTISTTDMDNILNAATSVMYPYSTSNMTAVVSCLAIDADKNVKVAWSKAFNGTARAPGTPVTVDSDLLDANTSQLLLSEVTYDYTPTVGYTITGTVRLSDRMYMAPRIAPPSYDGTDCK